MRLSDENVRGRTVIAKDGAVVGEIATLLLDTFEGETWRVGALKIKLRKATAEQIGASRGVFHAATIEVPVTMVQSVGDTVVLSATSDELRRLLPSESQPAPAPAH